MDGEFRVSVSTPFGGVDVAPEKSHAKALLRRIRLPERSRAGGVGEGGVPRVGDGCRK